jgi:hypothetical protein
VMECQLSMAGFSPFAPPRGKLKMSDSARVMEERTSVGPQVREFRRSPSIFSPSSPKAQPHTASLI